MTESNVRLILPHRYELIVGDTFELFFQGILNALDWRYYDFEMTFSHGENLGMCLRRKYCVTPTQADIGEHPLTIRVRDNTGAVVTEGTTVLRVSGIPQSPASDKVVLCIGDSLTAGGEWPAELYRRLTDTADTPLCLGLSHIRFIGTSVHKGVPYVGFGGWRFDTYNQVSCFEQFQYIYGTFDKTIHDQHAIYQDENGYLWKLETPDRARIKLIRQSRAGKLPSAGTLTHVSGGQNTGDIRYSKTEQAEGNPFWNTQTQSVDFAAYAKEKGVSVIDRVYLLLGWNCTYFTETEYKREARTLLNAILSAFPACQIGLVGLQVPSRDGFGNSYGVSWRYYEKLQFVWKVEQWYKDLCQEAAYANNLEYIQLSGQFDTEYSMPMMETTPNCRVQEKILVQSNGLHPAEAGYMQIADAVFRHLAGHI